MSQKAWVQAYTKGSKSLQARLAKIHANNPEFQEFVKKHGFGGNLSVKQSGIQKKSSAGTVKPVTEPNPERSNLDREAMIKAAAEKIKNRRQAHANRVAFGGELGGGFGLHNVGFRTYREARELSSSDRAEIEYSNELKRQEVRNEIRKHRDEVRRKMKKGSTYTPKKWVPVAETKELDKPVKFDKPKPTVIMSKGELGKTREVGRLQAKLLAKQGWKFVRHVKEASDDILNELSKDRLKWYVKHALRDMNHLDDASYGTGDAMWKKSVRRAQGVSKAKRKMAEDIAYKDGQIAMYKGGWIAKRDGKRLGTVMPTDQHAKALLDATHKSLAHKTAAVISRKAKEIARGLGRFSLATEAKGDIPGWKKHTKHSEWKAHLKQVHGEVDIVNYGKHGKAAYNQDEREVGDWDPKKKVGHVDMSESAANRRRVRSWDSAIMPELKPLSVKPKQKPPFDPDPPKSNPGVVVGRNDPNYSRARHLARTGLKKAMERDRINKTVDYISNPKYSVLDKNKINSLLKGK